MQKILALLVVCPLRCPRVVRSSPKRGTGGERGGMGRAGTGSRHLALLRKRELDRSQLRISRLFSEWPPLLTRSNNIAKKSHVTAGIGWQNIFILEHFGAFFEPKVLHYR